MELPASLPVMTLPSAVLFPDALLPVFIFEPRYREMLAEVLETHRFFCLALQRAHRRREFPSSIAGAGIVRACVTADDGTSRLIIQGVARVELVRVIQQKPYRIHAVRELRSETGDSVAAERLTARVLELVGARIQQQEESTPELPSLAASMTQLHDTHPSVGKIVRQLVSVEMSDPGRLADLVSSAMLSRPRDRQRVLESVCVEQRLKRLVRCLAGEIRYAARKGHD